MCEKKKTKQTYNLEFQQWKEAWLCDWKMHLKMLLSFLLFLFLLLLLDFWNFHHRHWHHHHQ